MKIIYYLWVEDVRSDDVSIFDDIIYYLWIKDVESDVSIFNGIIYYPWVEDVGSNNILKVLEELDM